MARVRVNAKGARGWLYLSPPPRFCGTRGGKSRVEEPETRMSARRRDAKVRRGVRRPVEGGTGGREGLAHAPTIGIDPRKAEGTPGSAPRATLGRHRPPQPRDPSYRISRSDLAFLSCLLTHANPRLSSAETSPNGTNESQLLRDRTRNTSVATPRNFARPYT